jgi:hypothetical protein
MSTYEVRLDKAALILCQLRFQDPDEKVLSVGGTAYPHGVTRLQLARAELVQHQQRDEAFELAGAV